MIVSFSALCKSIDCLSCKNIFCIFSFVFSSLIGYQNTYYHYFHFGKSLVYLADHSYCLLLFVLYATELPCAQISVTLWLLPFKNSLSPGSMILVYLNCEVCCTKNSSSLLRSSSMLKF